MKRIGTASAGVVFTAIAGGCGEEQMAQPVIVGRADYSRPKLRTHEAEPVEPTPKYSRRRAYPSNWYPEKDKEKKWRAVIVHHSATGTGCASVFHQWHKYQLGWDGIGYDFVIGNGSGSGDGEVEVTYRWRTQVTGAHAKAANNWANRDAIGVCLVGNFNDSRPTSNQLRSLAKLTDFLQRRYGISDSNVFGHRDTPRLVKATDCPGRHFPWRTFQNMLAAK
ncbi:peptidoglycan recognition family protein [Anaerohalosphaera lusitana]|uniref:peptidoglycan recognition protein family protein n=1 Tax=Anaerohalosphaera lusitana TaxID=1936003 RepID=UPI00197B669D|nr:peptidoglycan recognition family protein [Anaerohalosphaera lusitana]